MNPVLENKLLALKNANDYECWYLVKQPTAFDAICYLVSFLKEFQSGTAAESLEEFIGQKVAEVNARQSAVVISNNYRALRVAAFFGLIKMNSKKYEEASITDTFEEINARCAGVFERKDLYTDIIQRQIEKMYISSDVDEESNGIRKKYRLYPVMLLYKILLELGRATGEYAVNMTEYRYLIATTERFGDFLDTLLLIKLLREDPSAKAEFEQYRTKFDNRLIQALKQLPTLEVDKDQIRLTTASIPEVSKKVFLFENDPDLFLADNYTEFLGSQSSLFDLICSAPTTEQASVSPPNETEQRLETGTNVLLYGVPGSGKSWTIEHEYCSKGAHTERLVFHPDYTYSDFVGQILPNVSADGQVRYVFTPGPFTRILTEAYKHPGEEYVLVIEEINRGNAPGIFGEIFQLLDRKTERRDPDDGLPIGTSEYGITNPEIAKEVYGDETHKVRIPSNLSIIGTMNTSDQNVFTLDTAFQRRWEMRLVENNFEEVDSRLADASILDTGVTWKTFCTQINQIIVGNTVRMSSAEDKRLGAYFVHLHELRYDPRMGNLSDGEYDTLRHQERAGTLPTAGEQRLSEIRAAMRQNRKFPEKVLKYLWDDAFKFNRELVFDTVTYQSLEQVIHKFMYAEKQDRFSMFKDSIRSAFFSPES